mgnify:CR=1 FL=1
MFIDIMMAFIIAMVIEILSLEMKIFKQFLQNYLQYIV